MTLPDVSGPVEGSGPTDVTPPDGGGPPRRGSGWLVFGMVSLVFAIAGVGLYFAMHAGGGNSTTSTATTVASAEVVYDIPAGTGAKIDAGEKVEIIPSDLTLHVGQTLVLVNHDDRLHNLGGYQVRSGDTLRVNYPRPGLYMNSCSVNAGALVYVHVVA